MAATLNADKENRMPATMQTGSKMTPGKGTPGRTRRRAQDLYFDVGKVGRKTGLTLPDKGIRDEHGLEPVSGIFSSPIASPQRASTEIGSSAMQLQQSSITKINSTLHLRTSTKLPPPRAATPKHTNIGSPKRQSTGRQPHTTGRVLRQLDENVESPTRGMARTQPPANRVLDFAASGGEEVVTSIEGLSPFKPKRVLRRSNGGRADPFASPEMEVSKRRDVGAASAQTRSEEEEHERSIEDVPITIEDDNEYDPLPRATSAEVDEALNSLVSDLPEPTEIGQGTTMHEKNTQLPQHSLSVAKATSSKKRARETMQETTTYDEETELPSRPVTASPARNKRHKSDSPVQQHDQDSAIDPALLAEDDYMPVIEEEEGQDHRPNPPTPPPQQNGKSKRKTSRKTAPAPRRRQNATASPRRHTTKPPASSSRRETGRAESMGPMNNMCFRATTPFADAIGTTRSGRNVIKPLQYWANETRIWKNGECEGIIRAESVSPPKRKGKGKRKNDRLAKLEKRVMRLEKVDEVGEERGYFRIGEDEEEEETASTCADDWEESVGVIAGEVASWNAIAQAGDPANPVREDLAFSNSSIITRPVPSSDSTNKDGATFAYAKIMTIPFFGAGVVEVPPQGYKRAKNSRKMQMCFFVHEGKVMVEVGGGGEDAGLEVNAFTISRGGVWVVPRGNNYSITNESRTKTARIFFAQGCEVEALRAGVEEVESAS